MSLRQSGVETNPKHVCRGVVIYEWDRMELELKTFPRERGKATELSLKACHAGLLKCTFVEMKVCACELSMAKSRFAPSVARQNIRRHVGKSWWNHSCVEMKWKKIAIKRRRRIDKLNI